MKAVTSLSCYRNANEIASVLEGKCSPDALRRVLDFLKPHNLMEERAADYSSSVIILTSDPGRRSIWANLHVPGNVANLPQIRRTGTFAPWMVGAPLELNDNVTDPDLQRKNCLPLTPLSAIEEAFIFYLKVVNRARKPRITGLLTELLGPAFSKLLADACKCMCRLEEDGVVPDPNKTKPIFDSFEGCVLQLETTLKVKPAATARLTAMLALWFARDLMRDEVPEDVARIQQQLRDFFLAFKSSVKKEALDSAHFGRNRFHQITKRPDDNSQWTNLVVQGAGDLTMNQWNVAFIRREQEPIVIIPENEPYTTRTYTCLIAWTRQADAKSLEKISVAVNKTRSGIVLGDTLALSRLRIMPASPYLRLPDDIVVDHKDVNIAKMIDFALYGKLVLRDGELVEPAEMVDEFHDLRHVFKLPNLNPDADITDALKANPSDNILGNERNTPILNSYAKAPRNLFGQQQVNDVWLLEYALLADTNLRRLACLSKINVGLAKLGAPLPWIHYCLIRQNYQPRKQEYEVQAPGDFTWDWSDHAEPKLVIWLRQAAYPCTMVGIGHFNAKARDAEAAETVDIRANALFLLAWGHDHRRAKHSIWDCALVLKNIGARYAIALDEGNDVFQAHIPDARSSRLFLDKIDEQGSVDEFMPVPIPFEVKDGVRVYKRRSLRASLAFVQECKPEFT